MFHPALAVPFYAFLLFPKNWNDGSSSGKEKMEPSVAGRRLRGGFISSFVKRCIERAKVSFCVFVKVEVMSLV